MRFEERKDSIESYPGLWERDEPGKYITDLRRTDSPDTGGCESQVTSFHRAEPFSPALSRGMAAGGSRPRVAPHQQE